MQHVFACLHMSILNDIVNEFWIYIHLALYLSVWRDGGNVLSELDAGLGNVQ